MPFHRTCSLQVSHAESARSERQLHHFLQVKSDLSIYFGILRNIRNCKKRYPPLPVVAILLSSTDRKVTAQDNDGKHRAQRSSIKITLLQNILSVLVVRFIRNIGLTGNVLHI